MREPGYIKRSPRVATNYKTSVKDSDGVTVPVVVVDISKEGCRLETDGSLQIGEKALTPQLAADALAISARTLSRRLADEGTSFRVLLDDVRREFACALLQDRSLSVGDVAFFLQYSEPAAFHRSFRRWTGQTPRAFRYG